MREILFRGKRVDNGEWVEGYFVNLRYVHLDKTEPLITSNEAGMSYEVDPETIGQFTGLLDMNGKKIFEGDYVQLTSDVKKTFDAQDGDVRYSRGSFFVGSYGNSLKSFNTLATFDGVMRGLVVGNVHDNPELLKGE